MKHACTCSGIVAPGVSQPCPGCVANDYEVEKHHLMPLGPVPATTDLADMLTRERRLLDHQAQAVERAMVSFRAEHGNNERLIGTDYLSIVFKVPRRDFLARVVIRTEAA